MFFRMCQSKIKCTHVCVLIYTLLLSFMSLYSVGYFPRLKANNYIRNKSIQCALSLFLDCCLRLRKMYMLKSKFFALALLLASSVTHASLIVNGSFETNDIRSNSWKAFASGTVDGWEGTNMELWDNFKNFAAFDGEQYIELNANGNKGSYSIFQSINSVEGVIYNVSFAYAARSNTNEHFLFEVIDNNGNIVFSQVIDDHTVKTWRVFETHFEAQSDVTVFRFTSLNQGTVGNLIDAFDVNEAQSSLVPLSTSTAASRSTSVSEPGLWFMMSCVFGLVIRRKIKS